MSLNGKLQLSSIKLVYNSWGGSSAEAKALLQSKQWAEFKRLNPNVQVLESTQAKVHPYIKAEYAHGRVKKICMRKRSALDILKQVEALRDSRGFKAKTWIEKNRLVTKRPSIQGQWHPFFSFEGEPTSVKEFEPVADRYPRPDYSNQTAASRTKSWTPYYKTFPGGYASSHKLIRQKIKLHDAKKKAQESL